MERERFNTLLQDPAKITNNDIKALNEYRKKYPYFQGLYVIVAKALQQREHPKTEAFIKKAAIYSADRSYLKGIIEGEYTFPSKPDKVTTQQVKSEEKEEVKQEEKVIPKAEKKTDTQTATSEQQPEKQAVTPKESKPEAKVEAPKPTPKAEAQKPEEYDELKATKLRIEALLRGELPEEEKPTETPQAPVADNPAKAKTKRAKASQVDIIQKFIDTDPRFDAKSKGNPYEETEPQEDLSQKNLKNSEAFFTETMAELMLKQKKYKKAINIYEKLGLKFPEKSAYFARQIEKVKSEYNV
ncbi:hypothetical protein [Roseivirga pacifica]|uniref:hypothetical protein n=1 Tax=Roseivirga pacifica TaxID=1267423 RepID=UPI0020950A1E|nr:hypothetical protein [Roseivirga pacifica]MCO6357271.1 hypothetical protein [Roseivirga pacifica]MCO6368015.1 hypothetical protein [Roseivirga pacifica]MCO6369503.1 hypothetical protein [Roseivirga pacifica]MCO6373357.1 hypothetical protein [Roseivirga pacifica]MCO6377386.1 hypothetical protein [Roseivirga pacifica]